MAELTDAEIDAARVRGKAARMIEPRAVAVSYDISAKAIDISLENGCSVSVPVRLIEGLADAAADIISEVTIEGRGYALHWEPLDLDLSVPALMAGVFGTASWMAKLGGSSRSKAKAAASRANGRKGGRPRA